MHPSRKLGLFGSIKNKISRSNSKADAAARTPTGDFDAVGSNPFMNKSPATRRPDPRSPTSPTNLPHHAPPAYTAAPPPAPISPTAPHAPATATATAGAGTDDRYAFLSTFDTVFLIDDSGSMAGSLWRETSDALASITPICTAHDADGIDILFLNHPDAPSHHNITQPARVHDIFARVRPSGGTPTGQRLSQLLKPYLARYAAAPAATKPLNVIVITDGEPSDDVEAPIIAAARALDRLDAPAWQLGIQFFQVGCDEAASRHLKELDDELAQIAGVDYLRDVVDTVPFSAAAGPGGALTGESILKVTLGSVIKRLDRREC
ncbi:hypothetical protein LTR28_004477 [Elasticomyces elasticus]|nr:hypothetical protein LTR28_004477 [Elasticomyces elasticus]